MNHECCHWVFYRTSLCMYKHQTRDFCLCMHVLPCVLAFTLVYTNKHISTCNHMVVIVRKSKSSVRYLFPSLHSLSLQPSKQATDQPISQPPHLPCVCSGAVPCLCWSRSDLLWDTVLCMSSVLCAEERLGFSVDCLLCPSLCLQYKTALAIGIVHEDMP